jgi:hypothetical protein
MAATETVGGRVERARIDLEPTHVAVTTALVLALGMTLLFVQEPMVHDSMHNFRHAAGITCH